MILWNQRPPSLLKGRIFSIVSLPWGGVITLQFLGTTGIKGKEKKGGMMEKEEGVKTV